MKADERASEAVAILQRNGARLESQGRSSATATATAVPTGKVPLAKTQNVAGDQTMQWRAERLAIDNVRVSSGVVRIGKEVVTEQQSVDVGVSHDELAIHRHPVAGAAAVGGTIGANETITVPRSRDELRVGKETFVTEEVEIGKRAVSEPARVNETVRHEELVVDKTVPSQTPIR